MKRDGVEAQLNQCERRKEATMIRFRRLTMPLLVGVLALSLGACQDQQGPGDRPGEQLDKPMEQPGEPMQRSGEGAEEPIR